MENLRPAAVVGIGASAGGIEALRAFFENLHEPAGVAFVVIMHLPEGPSALADILGRCTAMPVSFAEDKQPVVAGNLYIGDPDSIPHLEQGRFRCIRQQPGKRERNLIDIFLASLAEDRQDRAIGVVLSGSGADGTVGIKAIREMGGLTIAQGHNHSRPRYEAMPEAAIASGSVDLVLPVEEMPQRILDYVAQLGASAELDAEGQATASTSARRRAICEILKAQVGHDFSGYKAKTFLRRVERRMKITHCADLAAYTELLRRDPEEVSDLFRDLLINVTGFFRDPDAFSALQEQVVPQLIEGRKPDETVRVWVPGCSTGEETYSLAILFREATQGKADAPKCLIFATDVDEAALAVARHGRYPTPLLKGLSAERLDRFFTTDGVAYTVTKELRDICVFSAHSLVRDPPFSHIDLISCRNLLIYFAPDLQKTVVPTFHYALKPRGYLFLGLSENVSRHGDLFSAVDKKHSIFKAREHVSSPKRLPTFLPGGRLPSVQPSERREPRQEGMGLRQLVETRILDHYTPAHVVVNSEGEIVYYSAGTGRYLEPAQGLPNRQLLAMARRGLRLELRSALQEAQEKRRRVVRARVALDVDDRIQPLSVVVEPLQDGQQDPLFLVLFREIGPPLTLDEAQRAQRGDRSSEQLERELRDTRERLQSVIEEYETALEELKSANEELVSVNEELQSTNEEMETSKEELQSVNEELQTVNQELQSKVHELDRANSDLMNLFESTEIATVFLDRNLKVRNFTPGVREIFSLIPSDNGRPLRDIATKIELPDLDREIEIVLQEEQRIERRVGDGSSAHYLMRILPYRSSAQTVDGVVLTFIDIRNLVAAEDHLQMLVQELSHRVRNTLSVVTAIARQTQASAPSPDAFAEELVARIEALGRTHALLSRHSWQEVLLTDLARESFSAYQSDSGQRIKWKGPSIHLKPKAAVALGMIFHELATNAVKYGSLSTPQGRLDLEWAVKDAETAPELAVVWHEQGGPAVAGPARQGFGSRLVEQQTAYDLKGQASLDFEPDGLRVNLRIPANPNLMRLQ